MTHLDVMSTPAIVALGWATFKATAILVLAVALARLLRGRGAAVRHLVWTVAMGSCVALLALPLVLPGWRLLPATMATSNASESLVRESDLLAFRAERPRATTQTGAPTSGVDNLPVQRSTHGTERAGATPAISSARGSTLGAARAADLTLALWLVGVAVLVLRGITSRVALRRITRSSAAAPKVCDAARDVAGRMRIARPVSVRESDGVDVPLTWGVLRPVIVVPADVAEWTDECRRQVLRHELAHVARFDAATQLVAESALALFWFHPLVWYAAGEMRRERECACDDVVLTGGAVASEYASHLLALVAGQGAVDCRGALAFVRGSRLEERLVALLDANADRSAVSLRRISLAVSTAAMVVFPLALVRRADARVVRQAGAPSAMPTVNATSNTISNVLHTHRVSRVVVPALAHGREMLVAAPPASASVPAVAVTPVSLHLELDNAGGADAPDVFAACGSRMANHDSERDGTGVAHQWMASGENGACRFDLDSRGDVVFNPDVTDVERLSPGAYLDVTANVRGDVAHLLVRAAADGAVSYELSRNGQPADLPAAKSRLAQFLLGLDRTTAFAIDRRFPTLLDAGGPDAVLAEVDRMHTDHARTLYLTRLFRHAPLDAGAIRAVAAAAASAAPRFEAGELLIALANRYALSDPVARATCVQAALALGVEHEKMRALLAIIASAPVDADQAAAIRAAAARMHEGNAEVRILRALDRRSPAVAR